jgi:hypothetical protein
LKKFKDAAARSLVPRSTNLSSKERSTLGEPDPVPKDGDDLAGKSAPPSEAEATALAAYFARRQSKAPIPRSKIETKSGVVHLSFDHADQAIGLACVANAFGTGSSHFASGLLGQLADASRTGTEVKSTELDFMLTVVRGIAPKDETEALLAAQMAAIHNATMAAARRLNHVESIAQQDSASNSLNKLARTFAAQLEALKRYRAGTEPTVKVQRVTVNDGGQAIVGNIHHGGAHEDPNRSVSSPQPSGALAPSAALLSDVETVAPSMPSTSGEGQESLPVPRGAGRRTERGG